MQQSGIGYRPRAGSPGLVRSGLSASGSPLALLRIFARDPRGAASIELALGAVVLVSVSALCFDLYSRIKADTAVARIAVTMADYVSRDAAPDGRAMDALGRFLHEHELGVPADLVYVITALHQPPGDPRPDVVVLWSDDTIKIGDPAVTGNLAAECAHYVAEGGIAALPDGFADDMADDEVLIIAEVCARLTREGSLTGRFVAGDIYRLHALPAREPGQTPSEPVYAEKDGTDATGSIFAMRRGGAGSAGEPPAAPAPSPGTAETRTRAEREPFHFDGRDRESLETAFRVIGQRLLTVRRVL